MTDEEYPGRWPVLDKIKQHLLIAPDEGWFTDLELHKTEVKELSTFLDIQNRHIGELVGRVLKLEADLVGVRMALSIKGDDCKNLEAEIEALKARVSRFPIA